MGYLPDLVFSSRSSTSTNSSDWLRYQVNDKVRRRQSAIDEHTSRMDRIEARLERIISMLDYRI